MLKIISKPIGLVPYTYNFDLADVFYRGQIGHFDDLDPTLVKRCHINSPHLGKNYFNQNSELCGIFDDIHDSSVGANSCINGFVTLWPFTNGLNIETDAYEQNHTYYQGDYLYVSWTGHFGPLSNCPYPGQLPAIAEVIIPPTANRNLITLGILSLPSKAKQPNTNISHGTSSGAILIMTNNGITYTQKTITWPVGGLFADENKATEDKIFAGITLPNGSKGSQCKNCGGYNEYVLEQNYVCFNCRV